MAAIVRLCPLVLFLRLTALGGSLIRFVVYCNAYMVWAAATILYTDISSTSTCETWFKEKKKWQIVKILLNVILLFHRKHVVWPKN